MVFQVIDSGEEAVRQGWWYTSRCGFLDVV